MRVATRARTQSRRAQLAKQFVGIAVTTAAAVGLAASPASAAVVEPVQVAVPGDQPVCAAGLKAVRVQVPFDDEEQITVPIGRSSLTVKLDEDEDAVSFDTEGRIAVRQVTVAGDEEEKANQYTYDKQAYPRGIAADDELVAPGDETTVDFVDFCLVHQKEPYGGNGKA